jgi:hypothetical protein
MSVDKLRMSGQLIIKQGPLVLSLSKDAQR